MTNPTTSEQHHEPPKNLNAERTVLGAALIDNGTIPDTVAMLKPKHFYLPAHQEVFTTICELFSRADPVDIVSLAEDLDRHGKLDAIGGAGYLASFEKHVLTTQNIEHYCGLVRDAWQRRELIQASHEIVEDCHNSEINNADLTDTIEARIQAIAAQTATKDYRPERDTWELRTADEAMEIRSPRVYLVESTEAGLFPENTVGCLSALYASHKTNVAIDLMVSISAGINAFEPRPNLAGQLPVYKSLQRAVCYLNFDTPTNDLMDRIGASIRARVIKTPPFFFYSMPSPGLDANNPMQMQQLQKRMLHYEIGFLLVDNLQLIKGVADENSSEMGPIIYAFKTIADRCNCPVLLIHHHNKQDQIRGATAIPDLVDYNIQISRFKDDANDLLVLHPGKVRGADIPKIGLEFSYTWRDGTKDFDTTRFWQVDVPDNYGEEKNGNGKRRAGRRKMLQFSTVERILRANGGMMTAGAIKDAVVEEYEKKDDSISGSTIVRALQEFVGQGHLLNAVHGCYSLRTGDLK